MIKDLYKTENMCFCQSIFIQLVHVFNPMFVNETNWLREDLLKKRENAHLHLDVYYHTQVAHLNFCSFKFILLLSF